MLTPSYPILYPVRKPQHEWNNSDLILENGQIGFDTTFGYFKIGDGISKFPDLPVLLREPPEAYSILDSYVYTDGVWDRIVLLQD